MKKSIFYVLIALLTVMFIPTVNAAAAPDYSTPGFFFANGTAIVISAKSDGSDGATITWEGGSFDADKTIAVIGGGQAGSSYDSSNITMNGGEVKFIYGGGYGNTTTSADVTNSNIIINNGTVQTVYGGGFLSSKVTTSNVTVNGGKYAEISGGGAASSPSGSVSSATDAQNSPCRVDTANVTINGGSTTSYSYGLVFGGGQGYSYTGSANLTINGGDLSNAWITSGGANGYTGNAKANITGGNLNIVQGVNRGTTESSKIEVTGGTINNLYAGAEPGESGVANKTTVTANGGTIANLGTGNNGGIPITDVNAPGSNNNIAYLEGIVTTDSTGATAYKVIIDNSIINGSVSAKIEMINGKPVAVLTVTPNAGYLLDTLTANNAVISSYSVILTDEETTIKATFKIDTSKDVTVANPTTFTNTSFTLEILAILIAISSATLLVIKIKKSNV